MAKLEAASKEAWMDPALPEPPPPPFTEPVRPKPVRPGRAVLTLLGLGVLVGTGLWPFALFYLGWKAARRVRIPTAEERANSSWFFFWVW